MPLQHQEHETGHDHRLQRELARVIVVPCPTVKPLICPTSVIQIAYSALGSPISDGTVWFYSADIETAISVPSLTGYLRQLDRHWRAPS